MAVLPTWVKVWLVISAVLCALDSLFVLGRPHSFELPILKEWRTYAELDKSYGIDHSSGYPYANACLTILEIPVGLLSLFVSPELGVLLAYTASAMTLAQTVLFLLVDPCQGFADTGHNSTPEYIFFLVMIGIWVVVPGMVVITLGPQLVPAKGKRE